MSSRSTTTLSFWQMYCCFRREPQVLCSKLKEMAFDACVAEYSLTGIDTRPKETVKDAIERAAMLSSVPLSYVHPSRRRALERLMQALLGFERVAPHVARTLQAAHDVVHAEIHRMRLFQLLPSKGHGYRGPRHPSGRISGV